MASLVELRNVTRVYQDGGRAVKAVNGINFAVSQKGTVVAIQGPSGSGKSTLLNLLGALDKPTEGQLTIRGVDIGELDERALTEYRRRTIGFVFQTFNLIPNLTALENVMLPMEFAQVDEREAQERARRLLEEVLMESMAGRAASKLSGGEQQRVAIARALANDPDIILADEPTGNLDTATGQEIVRLLVDLAHRKEKSVIIVTHDQSIVDLADEKLLLRDGTIVRASET